jgi:hypothetical protein
MPISEEEAAFIRLFEVSEPFEALAGGYMYISESSDSAQGEP